MSEALNDDTTVRAVRRAVGILRSFKVSDRALALGEIAQRAQLDKATTRRLLRTLMAEHLVEQNAGTKAYSLGIGVLELAAGATAFSDLRQIAQPVLASLAEAAGVTAFLSMVHADTAICIGRIDSGRVVPIYAWAVGGRMPLNIGAGPRVLMAHLPLEQRMHLLAQPLPALAPGGVTDAFTLGNMLETIRTRGWEVAVDEIIGGVVALGVPLHDHTGKVIAAVSIMGPETLMLDDREPRHLALLQAKTAELERRLAAEATAPAH